MEQQMPCRCGRIALTTVCGAPPRRRPSGTPVSTTRTRLGCLGLRGAPGPGRHEGCRRAVSLLRSLFLRTIAITRLPSTRKHGNMWEWACHPPVIRSSQRMDVALDAASLFVSSHVVPGRTSCQEVGARPEAGPGSVSIIECGTSPLLLRRAPAPREFPRRSPSPRDGIRCEGIDMWLLRRAPVPQEFQRRSSSPRDGIRCEGIDMRARSGPAYLGGTGGAAPLLRARDPVPVVRARLRTQQCRHYGGRRACCREATSCLVPPKSSHMAAGRRFPGRAVFCRVRGSGHSVRAHLFRRPGRCDVSGVPNDPTSPRCGAGNDCRGVPPGTHPARTWIARVGGRALGRVP